MVSKFWKELTNEVSFGSNDSYNDSCNDSYNDSYDDDCVIKKKHGVWCTMLQKIGVKNKRCKEHRLIEAKRIEDKPLKKQTKLPKIPKQLKKSKLFRSLTKSRKGEKYESFVNEPHVNYPEDETLQEEEVSKQQVKVVSEDIISNTSPTELTTDSNDESHDESGYETTTPSGSPLLYPLALDSGNDDIEFWSFDDLRSDGESADEKDSTIGGRFQRGWRSQRAKSIRRSVRKTSRVGWKGLQMSLRHQFSVVDAQSIAVAAMHNRRRQHVQR